MQGFNSPMPCLNQRMAIDNLKLIGGSAGAILLYLLFSKRNSRTSNLPLPPGPKCWPIVGCMFSIPKDEASWKWFARLGKEKGRGFSANGGELTVETRQDTVIVNSHQAAKDLFEGRSSIYSDRPHLTMASELIGWDDFLGMCRYGERARGMRRLLHATINPKAMKDWWPHQEKEAYKFLLKLLHSPERLTAHIRHTAGATVAKLTYGYEVKDESDEYIDKAEKTLGTFAYASTPGRFLVDYFPLLKHIPWAPFQRAAAEWRAQLIDFAEAPMNFVRTELAKGCAEPSFVSSWLENASEEDKPLIPWAAGSIYSGGADTTVSAVSTFFIAMLHHPKVQEAAQDEIDRIVGPNRLPNFTDRDSLPYIEAIYKEVLRWQPLAPIGIPRKLALNHDDEIPGKSHIIGNAWSMLRDPKAYQDPEHFNPSRFLAPRSESNPEEIIFGFGRRRCPGAPVAHSSVWLSIVLTLATYDISALKAENGMDILPSLDYTVGVISHPSPFQCNLRPRSDKSRMLIENTAV
ncbi:cytochrome P450 [Rhizoctonia solani]|uniref:Cytochrome P450 n=1 Tax=Rhizoctonia solani TaxID=456999 RepID=A0A8H7H3X4_9AGAM|nr:cytochrome P450 [Rhizoctonia solani]